MRNRQPITVSPTGIKILTRAQHIGKAVEGLGKR
jgi:hypothetical protein